MYFRTLCEKAGIRFCLDSYSQICSNLGSQYDNGREIQKEKSLRELEHCFRNTYIIKSEALQIVNCNRKIVNNIAHIIIAIPLSLILAIREFLSFSSQSKMARKLPGFLSCLHSRVCDR